MAKRLFSRTSSKKPDAKSTAGANGALSKIPSTRQSSIILVASLALFLIALFVWYRNYYTRPSVVLWSSLEKALDTPGVMKHIYRSSPEGSTDVSSLLRFDGEQGILVRTQLLQKTPSADGGETELKATAESLGIAEGDYQRYIETPKEGVSDSQLVVFDKILNQWIKTKEGTGKPGQLYIDSLLGTIPFGSINPEQRDRLMRFGRSGTDKQKPIFAVDYNAVRKTTENGRPVYEYELLLDKDAYTRWYQQYFSDMGFQQFADPRYTEAVGEALGLTDATKVTLKIDVLSRQIKSIARDGGEAGTTIENVYAYGIAPDMVPPANSLSTEDFQKIISDSTATQGQPAGDGSQAPPEGENGQAPPTSGEGQ